MRLRACSSLRYAATSSDTKIEVMKDAHRSRDHPRGRIAPPEVQTTPLTVDLNAVSP